MNTRTKFSLLCLILLFGTDASAQRPLERKVYQEARFLRHSSNLWTCPYDLSKGDTLDISQVCVTYRAAYPKSEPGLPSDTTTMILLVGPRMSHFYCDELRHGDSLQTALNYVEGRKRDAKQQVGIDCRLNLPEYELFYDGHDELTCRHRIPFADNRVIVYRERVEQKGWTIGDSTQTILGFNTVRATKRFAGRQWEVWFAPDIPIADGPWKLKKLPGLILRASCGEYGFEAVGITRSARPIVRYAWTEQPSTRKKYLRYIKNLHLSPLKYLDNGGSIRYMAGDVEGQLDDTWTIPYNPIERE